MEDSTLLMAKMMTGNERVIQPKAEPWAWGTWEPLATALNLNVYREMWVHMWKSGILGLSQSHLSRTVNQEQIT